MFIDSAKAETDQDAKNQLFERARQNLNKQVRLHPYHARLWFFKGYFHTQVQEWDSVISAQKLALKLGAGGTVNLVEHDAANMMNQALIQKVNTMNMDTARIFTYLDSCQVEEFENYRIHWLRGAIYNQAGDYSKSVNWLSRAYQLNSRDFDILYHYSFALARNGQRGQAIKHLQTALSLQPNNPAAKNLMNELNQG